MNLVPSEPPQSDSTKAYDRPERVRRYDADMDVMHPLRGKMIDVALDVLPFPADRSLEVLDLGVGTGVFTHRLSTAFPRARVVAVDGAEAMVDLARARLGELADRVEWVVADFRSLPAEVLAPHRFDAVVSSYALHHLTREEKVTALGGIVRALAPGGWLLNADLVVARSDEIEARIQEIRVAGVTARARAGDERFASPTATRATLDALEAAENDRPLTLDEDLDVLRAAGIENAEVFWKEHREAVMGGFKPAV